MPIWEFPFNFDFIQRPDWIRPGTRVVNELDLGRALERWIVERTFGWLGRCRRLSKDYEQNPASSEAFVCLAMTRLMARRLAT
ncbi:MAG: Anaerobic dehydrogenases, typically selenocysteine-containing [uncultured Gemmatimonadaceae bacterium]|uniref:Anaerobic dehydrogenases, typically selenocysteine-containing n=1 Tax=uncultured Gemmatimonadaceae bacterium TaxID=246130 RepID=A0A6J4KGI3_9BACT|nr:MAG: Anaerobic dehydrogenases, typically selenocysteine-containing [uncultured Gemmatimonadaceae bacterium]